MYVANRHERKKYMEKQYRIELRGTNPKTGVVDTLKLESVFNHKEMLVKKETLQGVCDYLLNPNSTNKIEVVVIELAKEVE